MRGKRAKQLRKLGYDIIKVGGRKVYQALKRSYYEFPEVIKPKRKVSRAYLFARALLHLKKYFTPEEIALIFKKTRRYIYKKLSELDSD